MVIDSEDTRQLLDEVGRFAQGRIASLCARPECAPAPAALEQLTQQACELGILSPSTAQDGFGIWEYSDDGQAIAFGTGALRHVARACAGIAFAWHRRSLARFVALELGLSLDAAELEGTLLAPTGHYGLARTSLARWLKSSPLHADDIALLSDWLDRGAHPGTLCGPHNWTSVLWPVWSDAGIAWQRVGRPSLAVRELGAQHGFDELAGFSVSQPSPSAPIPGADPRLTYERMLKLDMLGLLAIGAGVLDRGQQLARDYAALRRQGGKVIAGHPAVQHMLSDIEIARHNVDTALAGFARPLDALDAGALAATRASMSEALCHAANQVVQVHGGIGYMRDAGPEKLVRDQNMLKLMAGGSRDLHAFLAGWTGVCA